MLQVEISACAAENEARPDNSDDETDDDFPSIEELLSQISREGISTGGYQNPKDTLQHLEEAALNISGSRLSSTVKIG